MFLMALSFAKICNCYPRPTKKKRRECAGQVKWPTILHEAGSDFVRGLHPLNLPTASQENQERDHPSYYLSAHVWLTGADEKWFPKERCQLMENEGSQDERLDK